MALPLIPIAIGTGVRMAAPKVAQMLMKEGFKKASKSAVKKAGPNIGRISQSDAMKLGVHSVTKGGKPKPVPKSKVQKKLTAAVKAAQKETTPRGSQLSAAAKPKTKPRKK